MLHSPSPGRGALSSASIDSFPTQARLGVRRDLIVIQLRTMLGRVDLQEVWQVDDPPDLIRIYGREAMRKQPLAFA